MVRLAISEPEQARRMLGTVQAYRPDDSPSLEKLEESSGRYGRTVPMILRKHGRTIETVQGAETWPRDAKEP
jgi:hypothetical protein